MTYYKLKKEDVMQIVFAFVFKDDHPSETDQVQFAKDFKSFFKDDFLEQVNEDYEKGFNIFMKYFDTLQDDVKSEIHEKLNKLGLWSKNGLI